MKVPTIIIFILALVYFRFPNSTLAQIPEKVYRYCYTQESPEWYEKQAEHWKAELELTPNKLDAWYNYFFAVIDHANCSGHRTGPNRTDTATAG